MVALHQNDLEKVRAVMAVSVALVVGTALASGAVAESRNLTETAQVDAASQGLWRGLQQQDMGGVSWDSSSLLGKFVLLDFWASWCAPCLAEIPNLQRIQSELAGEDLVVLGISVDQMERSRLRSFVLRQEMDWPQFHDGRGLSGAWPKHFGVEAVPRTIVIDRAGRMVAVDLRGEALYVLLRDLVRPPGPFGVRPALNR